jgi:hypothetical protein
VDENLEEIRDTQHALAVQVFRGKVDESAAANRLGAKVASMMQGRISAGIDPPNAPATIEAKGSSKPLVNTGQLKSGITWRVED